MILTYAAAALAAGAVLLYRHQAREIPVLMYHRIADIPGDQYSIPPALFAWHLDFLQRRGYHTISLAAFYAHLAQGASLPPKPVVITLDDGYEDNFTNALPLLAQRHMTAAVFAVAGWVGKYNDWENYPGKPRVRLMTWEQLHAWRQAGFDVGSHTMGHPYLSMLTDTEIAYELTASKRLLEEKLGERVDFLCYPYGDFDRRVQAAAQAAGYKAAFAIYEGTSWLRNDLWALRRVAVPLRTGREKFARRVSPWHVTVIALKKWENRLKGQQGRKNVAIRG